MYRSEDRDYIFRGLDSGDDCSCQPLLEMNREKKTSYLSIYHHNVPIYNIQRCCLSVFTSRSLVIDGDRKT